MPRLSIEDACQVAAAVEHALAALPQDAPQRADWERVLRRLRCRLDVAQQGERFQRHGRKDTARPVMTCRSSTPQPQPS